MRRLPHAVAEHREKRDRLMHRQYAIGSGGSTAFAQRSRHAAAPPTPRRPRLDRSADVDARRTLHLNLPRLPCPLAGPCDPGNPCHARKRLAGGRIPRIAWTGKRRLYRRRELTKGYSIGLVRRLGEAPKDQGAPGLSMQYSTVSCTRVRRRTIRVIVACASDAVPGPAESPVMEVLRRDDERFSACRFDLVESRSGRAGIGGVAAVISKAFPDPAESVRPPTGWRPAGECAGRRRHGRRHGSGHVMPMSEIGR